MSIVENFYNSKPLEVFEAYGSRQPNEHEQLLIDMLTFKYMLPIPVINVLVSMVLIKTGGKFPKPYVEKIAHHWNKANVTEVERAMMLAKKDYSFISRNKVKMP